MTQKVCQVSDGVVVNVLLFEEGITLVEGMLTFPGGKTMPPPEGSEYMIQDNVGVGWTLSGNSLVAPTPPSRSYSKDNLLAYANAKQWSLATGGHTVSIEGSPHQFLTDANSMVLMTGKVVRLQQPNAPTSLLWQTPSGFVTFSAADFVHAATEIADFVQATFEALEPILAAIDNGTITTIDQIDAATWPSV